MVDIPRAPRSKRLRYLVITGGVVAILAAGLGLSRLQPAAPTVDRATLWVDTVRRGAMVRDVRGPGTLVPEQIRWISAVTSGRVEKINLQPGQPVKPATVLLELSNPDVELQLLQSETQLTDAEAQLVTLRSNLETNRLTQETVVAAARTQNLEAERQVKVNEGLAQKGLAAANEVAKARDEATEAATRYRIEQQRLKILGEAEQSQLAAQRSQIERLRAVVGFRRRERDAMAITAGAEGVLQELPVEIGQWVNAGMTLAKVVEPGRLKAVLRIPETQARDLAVGQVASIDTRNGIIPGRVTRIDPAAENGTVGVDVALQGDLPRGARPDLSVDGTIVIERLPDVLHVGRPAYGQPESTVGLFRLAKDGRAAVRVPVRLGRASVNTVEVLGGLHEGDVVVLSDMSQWDATERVRIR